MCLSVCVCVWFLRSWERDVIAAPVHEQVILLILQWYFANNTGPEYNSISFQCASLARSLIFLKVVGFFDTVKFVVQGPVTPSLTPYFILQYSFKELQLAINWDMFVWKKFSICNFSAQNFLDTRQSSKNFRHKQFSRTSFYQHVVLLAICQSLTYYKWDVKAFMHSWSP